jgi:hypothetical protein
MLHAACGHHDASRTVVAHSPRPNPAGLTHGGAIIRVTVTEQGDAALTVDDLGATRLWPSLDGKHPPVPVAAVGVDQIALAHTGDDFLAAFLDEAGDVLLVHLGRDGVVYGRAQIPGDAMCEQVVAIADGVLVVRADQSIERYDVDARLRGRIAARPGEQIATIAVRLGGAVALLSDNVDRAMLARRVLLDEGLAWGSSHELPDGVTGRALALSPDQRRIAVMNRTTVQVIELATGDSGGEDLAVSTDHAELGFADDDRLAVLTADIQWWPRRTPRFTGISGGAVGNGIAVAGAGASLVIDGGKKVRYLGWNRSALGDLGVVDSHVMLARGYTSAWLDDRLAVSSEREVTGSDHVVWLDPTHVVRYGPDRTNLIDLDHPEKSIRIADVTPQRVFYDPALHVLALYIYPSRLDRYQLDLDELTVTKLAPLAVSWEFGADHVLLDLLDPARAGGIVAIARYRGDVEVYRPSPDDRTVIHATHEARVAEALAVDSTGAIYFRPQGYGPIFKRHAGSNTELAGLAATSLAPSHGGALLAALGKNELAVYDAAGATRWTRTIFAPSQAVFSGDDAVVIVQTAGGLLSFDAATGTPLAEACAFGFGLHDDPPATSPLHADPICGGDDVSAAR